MEDRRGWGLEVANSSVSLGREPAARLLYPRARKASCSRSAARGPRVVLPGGTAARRLARSRSSCAAVVPAPLERGPELPGSRRPRPSGRRLAAGSVATARMGIADTQAISLGSLGELHSTRNQGDLVQRVLEYPKQREGVLHVRGFQELQPAVFHGRLRRTASSTRLEWCAARKSTACSNATPLAMLEHLTLRLVGVRRREARGRSPSVRSVRERLVVAFGG